MRPLALKWRLSIPVALATAIAMALMCVLAYDNFRELVLSQADRSLLSTGETIKTIMDDPSLSGDRPAHIRTALAAMEARPRGEEQPQLIARVWRDDGEIEIATGSEAGLQALGEKIRQTTSMPLDVQQVPFDLESPEGGYRAVWMRVGLKDGLCNIAVAQTTGPLYEELHDLLQDLILITFGAVIAVVIMSGVLIMLGLRPIRQTAEKLAGITAGNIGDVDWPSRSVPAELEPFVNTVTQMLDRLNAAMRQQKVFIADAAHELRTPIAVAKSTMQVALATEHSAGDYRQALQDATDDLRRVEQLVEELLTLARLDEGTVLMQAQDVDLTCLLADLAESFHGGIENAGGKLTCDLAAARVGGDASQLRRLFSNLLDNAQRHGPAGGRIRLTLRKQKATIEILVQDQGGSIPPEDLQHLFDRFYRADTSRSHSTGGAGLGLAIAKAITLRHGGTIQIESRPESGTCVRVQLPSLLKDPV